MNSFSYKEPVGCSARGDVEYFKTIDFEFLENYRMPKYGDTCLSIAASDGQLECCKEIYRRCPSHLYIPNSYGNTIFHHVSVYGNGFTSLLKFFLEKGATAEAEEDDIESGLRLGNWLKKLNNEGYTALCRGLHKCNLEITKLWIQADRDYNLKLLRITTLEGKTPLHLAVKYQSFEMVELFVEAEPDFIYGPDNNGETPLWIAMRIALSSPGNTDEANTAVKIRKWLLEKQPLQSTVRAGDNNWTSLMQAVHIGDVDAVQDIIRVYPTCMELLDNEGRNFLHIAVKFGQLKAVKHILLGNNSDNNVRNMIDKQGHTPLKVTDNDKNTPLHLAVIQKDLELVKLLISAVPDAAVYGSNKDGETPLSIAMRQALSLKNPIDQTTSAIRKVLMEKFPSQTAIGKGEKKWTLLHHATHIGDLAAVEDIIRVFPNGMELVDIDCQNFLHIAVKYGQLKILEHVLRRNNIDAKILKHIDKYGYSPFQITDNEKNTPMHLAVIREDLELVKLLADALPDAVYGTNKDGDTPLLISMHRAQSSENTGHQTISATIRKVLLEKLPNQSAVCTGEKKWTSLHHSAHIGDMGAIEDIIQFARSCMNLVDNEGRNFLHIAVKFQQYTAVKYLLETKDIDGGVLNQSDNYGNTPLHIAAATRNQNLILCFLYHPKVNKTTANSMGQQVLDAITFDYNKELAGVHGVRDKMNDKELKDQSDFDLVVGALIATVSFTAGITVPGGYISEGPNSGMALLSKSASFKVFAISNNFALIFSLYAVFSHFCTRHLLTRDAIIYQLNVATSCTLAALFAMMVAFITGSYAVLANSNGISIAICVNSCFFFIFAFRALLRMARQYKLSAKDVLNFAVKFFKF